VFVKTQFIVLFLILLSFNLVAEDIISDDEENNEYNRNEIRYYDLSGFTLELSAFNYYNMGLGYNWGEYKTVAAHFFAHDYGFLIEYKTRKELHFRIYADMYGGSAGMLLGASGILATNFKKIAVGIAPHVGVGFPGMKLFYRYNFYINKTFNCHEIALNILINPFDEKRRK
jgi:hypothetical protein